MTEKVEPPKRAGRRAGLKPAGAHSRTAKSGPLAELTPLPGRPVRGSETGRPLMALLDLVGRRWALRVLWELREGPVKFRDLQARCDRMSTSVLAVRLKELTEAAIVTATEEDGWCLTEDGRSLLTLFPPLREWSEAWSRRLAMKRELR